MKNNILFLCLLFLLFSLSGNAQYMTKVQLTNDIYDALYGNYSDPNDYPAANYPTIFFDLNEGSDFEKKAKLLTYLEFQDGIPVIWSLPEFNTSSIPYHVSIIKSLLEAWNVPIIDDGNIFDIGSDIILTYDIDDRLTAYSSVDNIITFKYNPYGQRIEATRNGQTTKYIA